MIALLAFITRIGIATFPDNHVRWTFAPDAPVTYDASTGVLAE